MLTAAGKIKHKWNVVCRDGTNDSKPMRMTFEMKGKDLSIAMESSSTDGTWTKTMDLMCKK